MINVETANIQLTSKPAGLTSTVFRADLAIHTEISIENTFTRNPEVMKGLEEELRRNLQEIIYGDLFNSVLNAHAAALQAAGPASSPSYDSVRASFEEVFKRMKVALPVDRSQSNEGGSRT